MARPNPKQAGAAMAATASDWDDVPTVRPLTGSQETVRSLTGSQETVRVRCIVHSRPFTHQHALAHGEEAEIPADIAGLMKEKGQVEYVG